MKKTIKIISKVLLITALIIVFSFAVLSILDKTIWKHTPERLLKLNFEISLKDFDYNVEIFDEQWHPNGDGHALIIYKFNKLTQENINYFKSFDLKALPIPEDERKLMNYNIELKKFLEKGKGYYIYKSLSDYDIRDFKVFIIDTENNSAILYYQYM